MTTPTKEWIAGFDALCALYIYHWADMCWRTSKTYKQRLQLVRQARKVGLLKAGTRPADGNTIHNAYNEALEAYAEKVLPPDWKPTYDYWGARCFSNNTEWNTPKDMPATMAGDKSGHYRCFASWAALRGAGAV